MGAQRVRSDSDGKRAARQIIVGGLEELLASVPELIGAIVASVDGLPIAHAMRDGDPAGLAAMASTAAGLGKHLVADQSLGAFAESVVRGELGYFAVYTAGSRAVLAVIAAEGANLGRVHLQARRCATKIASALEEAAR
jgi:predicted regulator of Ras-like GTPase activity (Roadblock/LC7/MglB family)